MPRGRTSARYFQRAMGFLVIHTPRTGSKKAATIISPGQSRHRAMIKRMVDGAMKQAIVVRASSDAQRQAEGLQTLPIRLENAIGIAVPLVTASGPTYEIYLLGGIDTAKIDAETTRDVQNRLVTQTLGLAEPLISTQIPWSQRRDPANHAQFSGDFVIRDELGSYALMFSRLPEAELKVTSSRHDDAFNPFNWKFLVFLLGSGALLYFLQNFLPLSLRPVSKAVSLISLLLWPFLHTSRYYVPFILRFIGYPGLLTGIFMLMYFYYNLLATSVWMVAVPCALFATIVAGMTVWVQGLILNTSMESTWSRILKYGGAIVINIIGLSIAWEVPAFAKRVYVVGSAWASGNAVGPGKITSLPDPSGAVEFSEDSAISLVARNIIKLKGQEEIETGAICFVRVPGSDKVYGLTSRRLLEARGSAFSPPCTPERLVSDLESWRVRLFRNKTNTIEIEGLAGNPKDYEGSEILFLKLKPGQTAPTRLADLSPNPPEPGEFLDILTPFESSKSVNQRPESAVLLAYAGSGDRMILTFGETKNIFNFEGSPIVNGTSAISGIVLGASPVTQRPFNYETDMIEAASIQQIWEVLQKVEGIAVSPSQPESTATPASKVASPPSTVAPTRPPAPPKPVVMPDPFASADIDKLEKEMKKLKKLRIQIVKAPVVGKSLGEQMKRETEIIRFNRRRNQIVAAFNRIGVQAGQETLELIKLNSALPDLSDSEKQKEYRTELDKIRAELQEKRKGIDPANMEQVESFYDETEWFNARSQALSRALTGSAVPVTPAPANAGAAPSVTPLPLPPAP